jgi:hypothetical protein
LPIAPQTQKAHSDNRDNRKSIMTDMPNKMYQPTKIVPRPEDDNGEELIESNMTEAADCLFHISHHTKQAVGFINQSLISVLDDTICGEEDKLSYIPLGIKAAMFDGHVSEQEVHTAMLKKYTWTTDEAGNIDPDGKAPQVHTDTENWSREQLMARWVHTFITEPNNNKAKKSVILSFYSEAFKLPASLPETGSEAAKKVWAKVAKRFVCVADMVFEFGDVFDPKNHKHHSANIAMMTGFSYEDELFIHDVNAANHKGAQDKRELFYAPKFVCDYVYDLAVKLLGEQNVPAVVAYCANPDYTPESLNFVRKSRQDTKEYVDSNPAPRKNATPEQWETWVHGYNQAVVYTVPMVGPAKSGQTDSPAAKLICPENDIGRAQYELTMCKGSNVDAKGSGYTLSQYSKLMTTHVYRTLESKYKNNTVLVVGSAGGSGKATGGGRGAAGSGALGKRRGRGASDDAAAAGIAGARRARVTMVDLKASLDALAQNRAQQTQLTVPPGMILLSAEQWESLKATVEKATTSVESLQTELSEQKKAVEEQTSRSDKMMAALEKVVNAKGAAVTVNVHKGAPPVEKAVGGAGGADAAATEATEATEASATPVAGVTKGAKKKLPEKSIPADPKIRDDDSDDDDDEEEEESESSDSESASECSSYSDGEKDDDDDDDSDDDDEEEEKKEEKKEGDVSMAEVEEVAEVAEVVAVEILSSSSSSSSNVPAEEPMETQVETQESSDTPEAQTEDGAESDADAIN